MAVGRIRVKVLAKYVSVVALVYFLVAIIVTMSRSDESHAHKATGDANQGKSHALHNILASMGIHSEVPKSCQEIHVAIVVLDTQRILHYVKMLKTLLYFRENPITLHIITNPPTKHVMSTLLYTWGIPGLKPYYYTINTLMSKTSERDDLGIKLKLHTFLPTSVTKVIVLDDRIRFTTNILTLWKEFDKFSNHTVMELYRSTENNHPPPVLFYDNGVDKMRYMPDVLLLDLHRWRVFHEKNALPDGMTSSWETVYSWFETHASLLRQLPCEWQLRIQPKFDVDRCLIGKRPLAFWQDDWSRQYSANPEVEQLKLVVRTVEESDGELLRHASSPCLSTTYETHQVPASCGEFRMATKIKRRTHLYLYGEYHTPESVSTSPYDVTLVTQLTPDRFAVLERLATQWAGPIHAVFHATELEAMGIPDLGRRSAVVSKRSNIAFHAVYKRGEFYPINYMRNVGINQSATPYTLFIDVDLVPNNALYETIKKYIPTDMSQPKETLVVPAFEAHQRLPVFPDTKTALLKLMANKTVEGYRMSQGWNLGHKPTNYPQWMTATKPYLAIFKDAFEPYVVLPTKAQPLFEESLLERMGDKIAYGRILYAMGYQFKVLPDQFVIHLPHAQSKGTSMWKSYPGYGRCSGMLFEEFRKETKRKYPWQKVH